MKSLSTILVEDLGALRYTPSGAKSKERNALDHELTAALQRRGISFEVPSSVKKAASLGLDLREKQTRAGSKRPGGTDIGVARAQLLRQGTITLQGLKRMRAYFTRHQSDSQAEGWGDKENPSPGWIAWLLWGGDEGREWAEKVWKEVEKHHDLKDK